MKAIQIEEILLLLSLFVFCDGGAFRGSSTVCRRLLVVASTF